MKDKLLLSFYGDDFTGSTDVMESLSFNGIPAALFLHAPDPEEVSCFRLKNSFVSNDRKLKAFGVAGISRSLSPAQMDEVLPDIFQKMADIPTDYFHLKICSTFDSSPEIGSIGHTVEIALRYFPASFIPLVVGIPLLNRFCVFGNLFARVSDITYRIDRHPTMSKHPITPMHEADLRRHLGLQTKRCIHLIDVIHLTHEDTVEINYKKVSNQGGFVLFDVLTSQHLKQIGKTIDGGRKTSPQLIVGSSGVEYALSSYWQESGSVEVASIPTITAKADRYIIIAGSCSPGTAKQIDHGLSIGYTGIRINSIALIENEADEITRCTDQCLDVLGGGGVPLLYSASGPDDPVIESTREKFNTLANKNSSIGSILAVAQGKVLKNIIDKTSRLRVTVAGGDTSGFVSKTLGIYALEVLVPIAPGAPLCVAHAKDDRYDGLEIALKGGQNGDYRYFECIQMGQALG